MLRLSKCNIIWCDAEDLGDDVSKILWTSFSLAKQGRAYIPRYFCFFGKISQMSNFWTARKFHSSKYNSWKLTIISCNFRFQIEVVKNSGYYPILDFLRWVIQKVEYFRNKMLKLENSNSIIYSSDKFILKRKKILNTHHRNSYFLKDIQNFD